MGVVGRRDLLPRGATAQNAVQALAVQGNNVFGAQTALDERLTQQRGAVQRCFTALPAVLVQSGSVRIAWSDGFDGGCGRWSALLLMRRTPFRDAERSCATLAPG